MLGMVLRDAMSSGLVHRHHGLDSYLIAFFPTEITLHLHGVERRCPPQSLVIWEPDTRQCYGDAFAPWEYSWLTCDGPFLQTLLEACAIPRNDVIMLPDPSCVDYFLQGVHRECLQYLHADSTIVHNLLQNWLTEIKRQLTPQDTSQLLPAWAVATKHYLEMHAAEPITLAQLADNAHFSVAHFYRKFKQVFGISPLEYQTNIRLQMARFLLLDNNLEHLQRCRANRL